MNLLTHYWVTAPTSSQTNATCHNPVWMHAELQTTLEMTSQVLLLTCTPPLPDSESTVLHRRGGDFSCGRWESETSDMLAQDGGRRMAEAAKQSHAAYIRTQARVGSGRVYGTLVIYLEPTYPCIRIGSGKIFRQHPTQQISRGRGTQWTTIRHEMKSKKQTYTH